MMTPEMLYGNEVAEQLPSSEYDEDLSDLRDEVENSNQETSGNKDPQDTQENIEGKNESDWKLYAQRFTGAEKKVGDKWVPCRTVALEGGGTIGNNGEVFGYVQKDFFAGIKEGWEIFLNEKYRLKNGFAINGQQFYWGKYGAEMLFGPQKSRNKQIGNVGIGASVGAYGTYDIIPSEKDKISGTGTISINFSAKQKDGKTRNGDAFLNINGKDFNFNNYGTYGEANLETPNILDPGVAGALCGIIQARYGGNIKEIELTYLGVGLKYKFK